jgi:hypothetical protein
MFQDRAQLLFLKESFPDIGFFEHREEGNVIELDGLSSKIEGSLKTDCVQAGKAWLWVSRVYLHGSGNLKYSTLF